MPALFLLPLLPGLWLAYKAWRTPFAWPVRLVLMALPILISQIFNIQHRLFGSLAGPDMPAWILQLQVWAFVAMLLVFFASLLLDGTRLCLRLAAKFRPRRKEPASQKAAQTFAPAKDSRQDPDTACPTLTRRSFLAGSTACGLGLFVPAGALVSGYGVSSAVAVPLLRQWQVFLPSLPEELEGLKLVHFADLHLGPLSRRARLAEFVTAINDWHPDAVLLGGDLADGLPDWRCADGTPRGSLCAELGRLRSRFGTFACTGNHEYYSSYSRWMALWQAQGIRFLHNEQISPGGGALVLGGLDDTVGRLRTPTTTPFASPVADEGKAREHTFRVLLDHRPGAAATNAANGAQLQLSGHTHGGQCLGLASIVARANKGFVHGWYTVAGMPLYVTSGAALWSGFAMRLGVPAEAACLTLHRGPDLRFVEQAG